MSVRTEAKFAINWVFEEEGFNGGQSKCHVAAKEDEETDTG